jgi:VIT1/CCC1 family predicted Fe2+/Mn2+ transporter
MEAKPVLTPEERREPREVVGVFDSLDKLQSAIDDLLTGGFDRSEISLLAEDEAARDKIGAKRVEELEDSAAAPRIPYIETESLNEGKASLVGLLFYVGALVGAIAVWTARGNFAESIAAGVLTGLGASLLGILFSKLIGGRQRRWVKAQLARGGLLLWARTWTKEGERAAIEIMQRHGGRDVHPHTATT